MLRAWRERDQEKRIKIAHQALERNPKYEVDVAQVFRCSLVLEIIIFFSLRPRPQVIRIFLNPRLFLCGLKHFHDHMYPDSF